jgi:hypothetical protein
MKKRFALIFPLAVLTVGFAVGCGGSDDSDSEPAPTKAEFTKQADDICGKANKELQTEIKEKFGNKQPSKEEAIAFTEDTIIPSLAKQLDDLEALTPPDSDDADVGELFKTLGKDIDALREDPASSLTPDAMEASEKAAEEYGFDNCGTGGTA